MWLNFELDRSGAFELFFYDPDTWSRTMPLVDRLEGFHPGRERIWSGYYIRTLMNLHLLPDDYEHEIYNSPISRKKCDLQIPKEEWNRFPVVPAWVYSNQIATAEALQLEENPVLWAEATLQISPMDLT